MSSTSPANAASSQMQITPERRWRIAWRSHATGLTSHGEAIFDGRAAAQTVCDDANNLWPELHHWPESIEPVELHCSNTPRCKATQPLPAFIHMAQAGVRPLPGFD